ncbi:uncharacterized protein Triagg1_8271 [Trichoderma aggressivum f. europaeum]|uniref:DUF7587 domain-containing protein n=1 Tax=Trichoderma aggressivum f. europaeum TaxID=173218 RepID=A0AAE1IA99_9HYPO|nr:hypothetical protein Triagg1_8271 [Trichoderma aggressivum f. europaeum]
MNELTTSLTKLEISQQIHVGLNDDDDDIPDEVPFRPSGNLATKLHDTPRYLFRVFSDASAGENSSECMKSVDALDDIFTDIFARDAFTVALTLNEHLRWQPKSYGDPFISWTTSLLVAIQYAIYKHKTECAALSTIHLCIIDTTLFPDGVFLKDLDLIEEFQDKVPDHYPVISKGAQYDWKGRGLNNIRELRNKQHKDYSGVYYFGEYLSQGQTNIKDRSCTVSCDKIINNSLFTFMPQFKVEIENRTLLWANAVIKLRQPFYDTEQEGVYNSDFTDSMLIAFDFHTTWFLPMLANILALKPRTASNPRIISQISKGFPDQVIQHLAPQVTNVVANDNIPEVLHFGKIIHGISQDYYTRSVVDLMSSMENTTGAFITTGCVAIVCQGRFLNINTSNSTTDVIRRFISESGTAGGRKTLGIRDLAEHLPAVDHDYVQPLMQSLETLSGIIQELEEDAT